MMKFYLSKLGSLVFFVSLALSSCNLSDNATDPLSDNNANDIQAFSKVGRGTIWADFELFRTVGTPAHFKADTGPFDELYNVGDTGETFKDGVGAISESKPGDQDFNGGRWHVNLLKASVPSGKYSNACSVEELDLNDFTSSDTYFECPLIPTRGNH